MAPWVYDPHSGGQKIPARIQEEICKTVADYSCNCSWYPQYQLIVRFKSQFCYIDTMNKDDNHHYQLCRLRYFKANDFSLALFMYSHERYEPTIFSNGKQQGTLIEALELCEPFVVI